MKETRKENGRKDRIVKGRLARDVLLNLLNSQKQKQENTHRQRPGQLSEVDLGRT